MGPTPAATSAAASTANTVILKLLEASGALTNPEEIQIDTQPTPPPSDGTDDASPDQLQSKLAAPVHTALAELYTQSIAGDPQRVAQHHSQRSARSLPGTGYLATGWLTAQPWDVELFTIELILAYRLFLDLPEGQLANDSVRCKCGKIHLPLRAIDTLAHIQSCPEFGKTWAHDTFGHSLEEVIHSVGPNTVLLEWEKKYYPTPRHRMDLLVSNLPGYAGKLAIDYTLSNPTKSGTLANATISPLHCAKEAHKDKLTKYGNHIPPGDVFVPLAAEIYGGVDPSVVDFMTSLAKTAIEHSRHGKSTVGQVLHVWRRHMSIALMRARCGTYKFGIEASIDPHAFERRAHFRQSACYRAVHSKQKKKFQKAKIHSHPAGGAAARPEGARDHG